MSDTGVEPITENLSSLEYLHFRLTDSEHGLTIGETITRRSQATILMDSEKEKMLNGELYDADDPELVAEQERARELMGRYKRTTAHDQTERQELLEELLGSTGEKCEIEPPFRCDYGYNIHVGENFYANFDCVILDVCQVDIGQNCQIAPGVHIYTATHPVDATERIKGPE